MKVALLGSGVVGRAIAGALLKKGHEVTIAARNPNSDNVKTAVHHLPELKVGSITHALADADLVFLVTPYDQAISAVQGAGSHLDGKILVDCTNPVGPGFSHLLDNKQSATEEIQAAVPNAFVVKAYSVIGYDNMEDPTFPGYGKAKAAMLIAGNDANAKKTISELLEQLGWEPVDCGPASSALHLEHMTLLWIKLAYNQGQGRNFVWSLLRR